MDPYRILGVARGCTREEVKEAFRAKVPSTHPDRGGADLTFIQLRAAYEQILAELDRRPRPDTNWPARVPRDDGTTKPLDPTRDLGRVLHEEAPHGEHAPRSPGSVVTPETDIAWLHRISAEAERRNPQRRWKWVRILGVSFLLYIIMAIPIMYLWGVLEPILNKDNDFGHARLDSDTLGVLLIVVNVGVFGTSCLIMWKNERD